ncbi:GIY-YIG nuclease family protein [Breoghania sp. L-A4]|uniref:GIY-YIG nuclease family protein n=1 Tax=Breoghania sp. L-A4 TaxID=2304600 RepID=UPI000E35DDFE|nr:GIY-YIG nuclease family protein [Breoghania sp. L-A4]AXS41323.1 GIY-YIG nuclease family protein [Breoghania sp. L-A4]
MVAWVYIMASKPDGVLYVGVTNDLARRVFEHRNDILPGFTASRGCKRLVFYRDYPTFQDAILDEKRIKRWRRAWKIRLIEEMNPTWSDLYERLHG